MSPYCLGKFRDDIPRLPRQFGNEILSGLPRQLGDIPRLPRQFGDEVHNWAFAIA